MSKRTIAEFEPLLAGEKTLLEGVSSGEVVPIGGDTVPDADAGEERQVHGDFLRYLLLGGCKGLKKRGVHVHEKGVRIQGALITGVLDLEGCRIPRDIGLFHCRFEAKPVLRSARIENLFLSDSVLPGLTADRLEAKGNVSLAGVVATGEVRLTGTKLGGNLDCVGARLTAGEDGAALSADRLETKGSVFLCDVVAKGRVRLLGAKLGGDLDCEGAQLTVGKDDKALSLDGARIGGMFFLRGKGRVEGILSLVGATFGALIDEEECWPDAGDLLLDRCQYVAFVGKAPVTADARIKWLGLQNPARFGEDFWPQPWEQCAKVLREMGHRDDARAILIDKEKRQRADRRKGYWFGWRWLQKFADFLLWATVAYGHKPLRAFIWLAAFWIIGVGVFYMAEQHDAIKPNDVRILRSAEWVGCANQNSSQLDCFLAHPKAASYPKFNAYIYSADTLLPIVALEMQSFWIPDDRKGGMRKWARRYLWLQIIAGWALSLLAVAGFSGLIKSD